MTPNFRAMLEATGNPGRGWVSRFCFEPKEFLEDHLLPLERSLVEAGTLVVYRDTVVKQVEADGTRAGSEHHRGPTVAEAGVDWDGYDRLPSQDLADWYSPEPSAGSTRRSSPSPGPKDAPAVFVDATEWGEVLVLTARRISRASRPSRGRRGGRSLRPGDGLRLRRALNPGPMEERAFVEGVEHLGFGSYAGRPDAWSQIWTYRRIKGNGQGPTVGDLSLQNWGYSETVGNGGNDYPFRYLFVSRADAEAQRATGKAGSTWRHSPGPSGGPSAGTSGSGSPDGRVGGRRRARSTLASARSAPGTAWRSCPTSATPGGRSASTASC